MAMSRDQSSSAVVGVFSSREDAQRAVQAFKNMGFSDHEVGIATQHGTHGDTVTSGVHDADDEQSYAGEGAASGAAAGAGIGALWGLGILAGALPAVGPAIAGGTLAILFSSAVAGAATGGLAGALIGLGVPKDEAEYYEAELKAGRTIVTVQAGARQDEVLAVMRQYDGYNITNRGHFADATAPGAESDGDVNTLQARSERLKVEKSRVQAGEVEVTKEVHTDHKTIDVPVCREEIVIERRPVAGGRASPGSLDAADAGEAIRVPLSEEHIRVEKEVVPTEEVTVGKRQVCDTRQVQADLQREEIAVEDQRVDADKQRKRGRR